LLTVIWHIEQWCSDTADWCAEGGIIRKWAEPIFRNLHDFFSDTWDNLREVKEAIPDVTRFLNGLYDGWGLNDLLSRVFGDWDRFRTDPKGFISDKLGALIPNFSTLVNDPWEWLLRWVVLYDNPAYLWLHDPVGEIRRWFENSFDGIFSFFDDPVQKIKDWIRNWNEDAYQLINDPIPWIQGKLTDQLGWDYWFWLDPWGYLIEKITDSLDDRIETWGDHISRVGERVVRFIWEGRS